MSNKEMLKFGEIYIEKQIWYFNGTDWYKWC